MVYARPDILGRATPGAHLYCPFTLHAREKCRGKSAALLIRKVSQRVARTRCLRSLAALRLGILAFRHRLKSGSRVGRNGEAVVRTGARGSRQRIRTRCLGGKRFRKLFRAPTVPDIVLQSELRSRPRPPALLTPFIPPFGLTRAGTTVPDEELGVARSLTIAYTLHMSTVRLTPHSEELLQQQLARGSYRSSEEVIERALETLAQRESNSSDTSIAAKTPAEAVADILEIQKRNRLDGLKIKDLVQEGRKY